MKALKPLQNSSLFWKTTPQLYNFDDYVMGYDVIGHDVIGHSDIATDNFGLGQPGTENRLVINVLQ